MKAEDKSLRIGAAIVVCALLLRLLSGSWIDKVISFFSDPDVVATMILLETGQALRFPSKNISSAVTEPASPQAVHTEAASPVFTTEDATLVQINNASGCAETVKEWLLSPLELSLTGADPTVLILHTHASESYAGSCDDTSTYRTQDEAKNMLSVGQALTERLQAAGIQVLQDRTIHDYPSYNGSYTLARSTIRQYLEKYPTIQLVLDLHRDAMTDDDGNQIASTLTVNGNETAKLMMVVGTNAGGLNHPQWQQNMALATKLHAQLEKANPGICRPISFRSQRFNQDLSTGAILVEVGAAGNTLQQALYAADLLADAIIALSQGANR